ncbi:MAG: hypothetical protein N2042_03480 [Thermodesulfovibrio sp.]|nr:hypothetical protein [Thermodesulfovibrio sp.]MDW7972548.1 hypothetical protein [Thermodesulfovibrio sp.]
MLNKVISSLADIMVSVPVIIIGAFIYAIIVKPLGHFSGWAGAIALGIIMIPTVLRTTENMLSLSYTLDIKADCFYTWNSLLLR